MSIYGLFQAYYKKQSDENTINFYNEFIKRFGNYKYLKNIQEFRGLNLYEDADRESFLKEFFFSIVIKKIDVINCLGETYLFSVIHFLRNNDFIDIIYDLYYNFKKKMKIIIVINHKE